MARTIADIKKEITDYWVGDTTVRKEYGLSGDSSDFDAAFTKASIESVLFYCIAACVWTLETLFDLHRKEVQDIINDLKPHSLRWYVSKAKAFMKGYPLVQDTDVYDTSRLTEEQIAAARVIRYAAAVERNSVVYLKIAGDLNGEPAPVDADTLNGFKKYIGEVKDAGTVVETVNEPGEHFRIKMDVYYNPMILTVRGLAIASGAFPVHDAVRDFVKNLPFDGEYRNVALTDAIQKIDGVVIPELILAETSADGVVWNAVNARTAPWSGYCKIYEDSDMNITFIPYENI